MKNKFETKILPKKKSFRWQRIWRLRYRLYAIAIVVILLPVLFANDINLPDQVTVNSYDFEIVDENMLAQGIRRIPRDTEQETEVVTLPSQPDDLDIDSEAEFNFEGYDIYGLYLSNTISRVLGINSGFVSSLPFEGISNKVRMEESELESIKNEIRDGTIQANQSQPISQIVPAPATASFRNLLVYDKYKIRVPIQYLQFEDLFNQDQEGYFSFTSPLDTSSIDSPVQKKLEFGIVHMAYTPRPGEVGNSYIVGHSSNYSFVSSPYNTVFKPIQEKSQPGEVFTIYDERGRKLDFRVFEAIKIEAGDIATAYKNYPGQRVVTLQTSVLGLRNGKWEATHRWLTRGELIL